MERSRKIGILRSLYAVKKVLCSEVAKQDVDSIRFAERFFRKHRTYAIGSCVNFGVDKDVTKIVELFDSISLCKDLERYLLSHYEKKTRSLFRIRAEKRERESNATVYLSEKVEKLQKLYLRLMDLYEDEESMDGDVLYFSAFCLSKKCLEEVSEKEGISRESLARACDLRKKICETSELIERSL